MQIIINLLIGIISFLHLYFLYFEMFAWTTLGKRIFRNKDPEFHEKTKALAANQGLYNGFLSAGLIWTFFIENVEWKENISLFFLGCVAVAGIYGAITASKKIFFVQALPAIIAIVMIWINK
jgi:putative membrane protein